MNYRKLGRTGFPVSEIGYGAWGIGGTQWLGGSDDESLRALRRAIELGVNHIDTAAFYFSQLRSANELINSALAPYPDDLVITTKVGPGRDASGEWMAMARPDQLRGQVEENLRQLGRDHLDVVNLRRLPSAESIAEHFGALAELRDAGLIRHLGISAIGPEHLAGALAIAPVVCVQNMFGLAAGQADRDLLRICGEQGIAFVPFFAIAGSQRQPGARPGNSAAADADYSAAVDAVARAHGATAAQVRLAWTLALGPHVLAIPGTGNPEHLEANIAAGALRLSAGEMALLDALSQDPA